MEEWSFEKVLSLTLQKMNFWLGEFFSIVPNLIVAPLVLLLGLYLVKKVKKYTERKFSEIFPTHTLANLMTSFVNFVLLGIVLFVTLKVLHLDSAITTTLAGAGIISLGLAFAFQDIAANFISGVVLAFRRPFQIGELIKVKDFEGIVLEVNLRETIIRTHQGQIVALPNKDVFQSPLTNFSSFGKRRADISGGVADFEDLKKVKEVALEALKKVPNVIQEDIRFYFESFGDSTIDFQINIWVNSSDYYVYKQFINDAIIILKEAFEQNNITMPHPIVTLDFGMKGGEKLSDMVLNIKKKDSEN